MGAEGAEEQRNRGTKDLRNGRGWWRLALVGGWGINSDMSENAAQNQPAEGAPPASTTPRERPMRRDGFMEGVFWVLGAFLTAQIVLMAWLDI
jgi:hypothetical protein